MATRLSSERRSENDRNVESVRATANNLLSKFKDKVARLEGKEEITRRFIRQGYDPSRCLEVSKLFFGSDEVDYIAIDGTMFEEARLDMMIFYAGAFAYGGTTTFEDLGRVKSEPVTSTADYLSIGSAIPLSEEYSSDVFGELGEGGIEYDPSKVSSAIMRLAEYYLAYRAMRSDPKLKIILMDRTVSGDIAHTSWKLREYIKEGKSALAGFDTSSGAVSQVDLELGRMLVYNRKLGIPAPRSQFLGFAAIRLLMDAEGPLSLEQIVERLGANESRGAKIKKELSSGLLAGALAPRADGLYQVREGVPRYWERLLETAERFAEHIFGFSGGEHPLRVGGAGRWLTCFDIDYLSLVFVTEILNRCWSGNILLLGIVKDSRANEFVRTVIRVLENAKLVDRHEEIEAFGSDTMLLQANSVVNCSILSSPWRTFEYDVCFRTISPVGSEGFPMGECRARGAYNNVIAPERTFVKAYFQLWNSEENPTLRSHVFIYDRPCYPDYDDYGGELKIRNRDADVDEEITPMLHYISESKIADLVMGVLQSMGNEAIPEALGHNYPLFLADKRAKLAEEEASRSCVAAVELEIAKSRLDQQLLYQQKFRDMRSDNERRRKRRRSLL